MTSPGAGSRCSPGIPVSVPAAPVFSTSSRFSGSGGGAAGRGGTSSATACLTRGSSGSTRGPTETIGPSPATRTDHERRLGNGAAARVHREVELRDFQHRSHRIRRRKVGHVDRYRTRRRFGIKAHLDRARSLESLQQYLHGYSDGLDRNGSVGVHAHGSGHGLAIRLRDERTDPRHAHRHQHGDGETGATGKKSHG